MESIATGRTFTAEKEWQYRNIFDASQDGLMIVDLETGLVLEANPAACRQHGFDRKDYIGLHLTAFIHPDNQRIFNEYARTYQEEGSFDAQVLHVRRDGSTFIASWRGTAFIFRGRPCLMGNVRDISKRIHSEKLLHQHLQEHTLEQSKLLEISLSLASTLEFHPDLILDQLREIIAYSCGGLFALQDTGLVTLTVRGAPHLERLLPFYIPLQDSLTLEVLFNGHHPIRIADIWSDIPQALFLRSLFGASAAELFAGMHSWIWVPLVVKGRLIGGLGVAHQNRNYFTSHHADLALSVANQAAIAMVNAELNIHAQALAVMEERQRLARNLHDAINQSLFSAGLIAEVLPRLWERDQEEARRSLLDLRRLTRGAQAEMRALLAELRPSTLTDADLGELLQLLGNALSGRINIPVVVTVSGVYELPAEVQIVFYRICQEALNNSAKHANASQIEVDLKRDESGIMMCVRDDGQGFDPEKTFSGHYGLSMMRERAEAVGARLDVSSHPGSGTELTVCWTQAQPKEVL